MSGEAGGGHFYPDSEDESFSMTDEQLAEAAEATRPILQRMATERFTDRIEAEDWVFEAPLPSMSFQGPAIVPFLEESTLNGPRKFDTCDTCGQLLGWHQERLCPPLPEDFPGSH